MLTPSLPSFDVPRLLDRRTAAVLRSATVALLVILVTFSLAVAGSADRLLLDHAGQPTVITAVIPEADEAPAIASEPNAAFRAIVSNHEDIARVESVDPGTTTRVAQILLGEQPTALPLLLDLILKPESLATAAELEKELGRAVPGITLVDGNPLSQDLRGTIHARRSAAVITAASLGVLLIFLAWILSRLELAWHDREVRLLRLLGATDSFISRNLARDVLRDHFKGAGLGLVIGGTIILVPSGLSALPLPVISEIATISSRFWVAISATALLSAPLATLAAHLGTSFSMARRHNAITRAQSVGHPATP